MKIPSKCHNHEYPKKERWETNNDSTDVTNETTNVQTKKNCNRRAPTGTFSRKAAAGRGLNQFYSHDAWPLILMQHKITPQSAINRFYLSYIFTLGSNVANTSIEDPLLNQWNIKNYISIRYISYTFGIIKMKKKEHNHRNHNCKFVLYTSLVVVPRLGKRELILVLFVRLFDMCLFEFVGFFFLLVSRKGCGLWLWHSLDFSLTFFISYNFSSPIDKDKHLRKKFRSRCDAPE